MAELYNHKVVEKKWQKVWDDEKAFAATNDFTKPKYYAHRKDLWRIKGGARKLTSPSESVSDGS